MAASFSTDLLRRIGAQVGDECRAKGVHILLGPTVNIQRSPLGGRGFESYSEDPRLSGTLAAAFIEGVQSKGVDATIKHYVCKCVVPPDSCIGDLPEAPPQRPRVRALQQRQRRR